MSDKYDNPIDAFIVACKNGDLVQAQALFRKIVIPLSTKFFTNIFEIACNNGRIKLAQWLREIKPDVNCSLILRKLLMYNQHDEIVKWLILTYTEKPITNVAITCMKYQRQDLVEYIISEFDIDQLQIPVDYDYDDISDEKEKDDHVELFNSMVKKYYQAFANTKSSTKS